MLFKRSFTSNSIFTQSQNVNGLNWIYSIENDEQNGKHAVNCSKSIFNKLKITFQAEDRMINAIRRHIDWCGWKLANMAVKLIWIIDSFTWLDDRKVAHRSHAQSKRCQSGKIVPTNTNNTDPPNRKCIIILLIGLPIEQQRYLTRKQQLNNNAEIGRRDNSHKRIAQTKTPEWHSNTVLFGTHQSHTCSLMICWTWKQTQRWAGVASEG